VNFPKINVVPIVSAAFQENAYILHLQESKQCLIVDPGLEPEKILAYLDQRELVPSSILITHGHSDHIAGNEALKSRWPECPLVIGTDEAPKLTDPHLNLSAMFGLSLVSPPADITVDDGDSRSFGGMAVRARTIPGHSSGHVVYIIEEQEPQMVLVGDVIFAGGIGRYDFPDGDFGQLRDGIHQKLFTLPDSTILLPGHGPATTVGEEKRSNPFVGLG